MDKLTYPLALLVLILAIVAGFLYLQASRPTSSSQEIENLTTRVQVLSENTFWVDGQPQIIPKGSYTFGVLPDSFSVLLNYTTNISISTIILTDTEYANFQNNKSYVPTAIYNGSSQDIWINISRGCAGYVYVQKAPNFESFKYYPEIYIKYNPSAMPTGTCSN